MAGAAVSTGRLTGTVKWFNDEKGFGFISPDTSEDDLLAPSSEIRVEGSQTLRQGQRVTFDVGQGPEVRLQAVNITPLP